jgi:NAD(P)-dependent dehydrogenase (short-subunit alcohol dehydrogenase family)
MNAQRIEGAVALVTGANRGIGRALTEALLTRGVKKVYATARNPEALGALRDNRLVSLRLDVTDADQIRAAGEAASDVELVFNNAGVALATGIAGSTVLDQARREMEVNYFGPLQLLHRLAPVLARNGGGGVRDPRRHGGRAGGHLPGPVRGGFCPTVRVLAEGLGTADRRNDRCDAIALRGVRRREEP